ncbi:MAG: histidinol-phosphate transaminase [Gammaproteobacteria bacterium]|nr:histidinol-phosphate transaminase [Gammaproteobacteria bacterium]
MDYLDLAAPGLKSLHPYQPGKPIDELQREYGVARVVKLASNENPLGPSPRVLEALRTEMTELARYPDGNGFTLKKALSEHLQVDAAQLTIGNGSNDLLELIGRAFVTPANEVIFSEHSFAVYPLVTQALNARAVVTPAKDWGNDLDAIRRAIVPDTRLIFIANPNNPTGTWLDSQCLETFLADVPKHVIVVLDEAYFEYASGACMGVADYPNALQWLNQYSNLIVTRTFSKAYGLAGLRVGYCVSHPQITDLLNRVRQPFNVNQLALAGANAALQDNAYLERVVALNCSEMRMLCKAFDTLGLVYIPSVGNFVAVDVGQNAASLYDALLHEGVIVRPVANYGMPQHLRVTVGTEEENNIFVASLKKVLGRVK